MHLSAGDEHIPASLIWYIHSSGTNVRFVPTQPVGDWQIHEGLTWDVWDVDSGDAAHVKKQTNKKQKNQTEPSLPSLVSLIWAPQENWL